MTDETNVTVTFAREECDDCDPDTSYMMQDYADVTDLVERQRCIDADAKRLAAYKRDEWHYIGIRAKATIVIARPGYSTHYTLESPGLWNIESDSDEDYLQSVFKDECATLRRDIKAIARAKFKE